MSLGCRMCDGVFELRGVLASNFGGIWQRRIRITRWTLDNEYNWKLQQSIGGEIEDSDMHILTLRDICSEIVPCWHIVYTVARSWQYISLAVEKGTLHIVMPLIIATTKHTEEDTRNRSNCACYESRTVIPYLSLPSNWSHHKHHNIHNYIKSCTSTPVHTCPTSKNPVIGNIPTP